MGDGGLRNGLWPSEGNGLESSESDWLPGQSDCWATNRLSGGILLDSFRTNRIPDGVVQVAIASCRRRR